MEPTLALLRENITLLIAAVVIVGLFLGLRFYSSYNSIRARRKRALVQMVKAHIDMQYVEFDDGVEQLESSVDKTLTAQMKRLQQSTAVPEAVRQVARTNKAPQPTNAAATAEQ